MTIDDRFDGHAPTERRLATEEAARTPSDADR